MTDTDLCAGTEETTERFCLDCAHPSQSPFCPTCLEMNIEDSRTGEAECWVPVAVGREDLYRVSSFGRVRSLEQMVRTGRTGTRRVPGRILKPTLRDDGRLQLGLGDHAKHRVHRIVLTAFVGPCPDGLEGCHWNDIGTDNRLCNLRWDTRIANVRDAIRNHGGHPSTVNITHCPQGHEYTPENTIFYSGRRRKCRECRRRYERGLRARKPDRDAHQRAYRERNRDAINARQRERRAAKRGEES